MAYMDSADLLARVKVQANRPANDQSTPDASWYQYLGDAQLHWTREIANAVPDTMYVFELLTTSDSGVTYDFVAEPLGHYELRSSPTGRLMIPGPDWDTSADFVPAGQKIRFPGSKAKTFTNGPYARYVKMPTLLNASNAPTMQPTHARVLLVYHACALWAAQGGLRDPAPFRQLENQAWFGDSTTGQGGILAALHNQALFSGTAAIGGSGADSWWTYIDSGEGYVKDQG